MNLIPGGRRRFNELAGTNLDRLAGISDGIVFPTWVGITLIFLVQLNYASAPRIPILHRF